MGQLENYELTARDLNFLKKFRELINDSDGVSYFGWMECLTSLAYRIQKETCDNALIESKSLEDIPALIDSIQEDIVAVCGIVANGMKDEVEDKLLAEDELAADLLCEDA